MIYCDLTGGLGYQLFQIFATISYALQYKHQFRLPNKKKLENAPLIGIISFNHYKSSWHLQLC